MSMQKIRNLYIPYTNQNIHINPDKGYTSIALFFPHKIYGNTTFNTSLK